GLKGARIVDAQISKKHANFIVNRGHATAADTEALIRLVGKTVEDKFGTTLELEVQMLGRELRCSGKSTRPDGARPGGWGGDGGGVEAGGRPDTLWRRGGGGWLRSGPRRFWNTMTSRYRVEWSALGGNEEFRPRADLDFQW